MDKYADDTYLIIPASNCQSCVLCSWIHARWWLGQEKQPHFVSNEVGRDRLLQYSFYFNLHCIEFYSPGYSGSSVTKIINLLISNKSFYFFAHCVMEYSSLSPTSWHCFITPLLRLLLVLVFFTFLPISFKKMCYLASLAFPFLCNLYSPGLLSNGYFWYWPCSAS